MIVLFHQVLIPLSNTNSVNRHTSPKADMSPNKWYYNIVYTTTKGHADYEIRVKVAQIGAKLTQLGLNKARFGLEWVLNG